MTSLENSDGIHKTFTEYQIKFLINLLKNHKKLRKSHFTYTQSGVKMQKITNELVMVDGLIEYLSLDGLTYT